MLTMARAVRVVTDWVGDPSAVIEYGVRMTRPVVVPDGEVGSLVEVSGVVAVVNDDGTVRVDLTATFAGETVLAKAQAVVRLG
jgi:acyl dehydratase